MSGSLKLGLILIVGALLIGTAFNLLVGVVGSLLGVLKIAAIVAGIGLVIYGLVNRKALGGSRRYLP